MHPSTYDAVILAGGEGRRLGGRDKAAVRLGAATLLQRALLAVETAGRIVVVGPPRSVPPGVLTAREEPAGGGPVAGLYAGFDALAQHPDAAPVVAVLAVDMPNVDKATIARLVAHLHSDAEAEAAFLTDGSHHHLAGCVRASALAARRPETTHAHSVRRLLADLVVADVAPLAGEERDIDTPEDLSRHLDETN